MAAETRPVQSRLFKGESRAPRREEKTAHTVQQPSANIKYKAPIIARQPIRKRRTKERPTLNILRNRGQNKVSSVNFRNCRGGCSCCEVTMLIVRAISIIFHCNLS